MPQSTAGDPRLESRAGQSFHTVCRGAACHLRHGVPIARDASCERARKFAVVVAQGDQRVAAPAHRHDAGQHTGRVGAAIHEIAHEERAPTRRRAAPRPAQSVQEGVQGPWMAVDVADHVERAMEAAVIAGQRRPVDPRPRGEIVDGGEPLSREALEQARALARRVAGPARGQVGRGRHQRHERGVVPARERDPAAALGPPGA